ncbi:MAG: hypothetical protein ABI612_21255 [Betaproteobacteria bacterium]
MNKGLTTVMMRMHAPANFQLKANPARLDHLMDADDVMINDRPDIILFKCTDALR